METCRLYSANHFCSDITNLRPRVSTGLTAATIVFGFIRNLVLFSVLVRAAQSLHNRMFNSILRTHVRFFDINPIGERIIGRPPVTAGSDATTPTNRRCWRDGARVLTSLPSLLRKSSEQVF